MSIPFHEVLLRAVHGVRPGQAHGFDNQIVSADVRFRPPLGELPLGIDATRFSESCCGNPRWYRHGAFLEGWSEDGRLLGLLLGGQGREIRIFGNLDVADARGWIHFEVFGRSREAENVFWPQRAGDRRGFARDVNVQESRRSTGSPPGGEAPLAPRACPPIFPQ